MTSPFIQFLLSITVFEVVKWFLVVGLLMYSIFAVVIVRQVGVMSESIEDEFNPVILAFAWIHLAIAIILLVGTALLL